MNETIPAANVMIIDDGELDTFIVKNTIKHVLSNINIKSCVNGLKALQTLRHLLITDPNHLPDYIFLDLSMPIMDGFQFLDEYNNLNIDAIRKIKIYVLSSSILTTDIKKALENSFVSGFISKPIDSKKLREIFNVN